MNNEIRTANFTSSNIFKLMTTGKGAHGFGEKALTYIQEKRIESRIGRGLDNGAYSRDMAWGEFVEARVFDLLGLDYKIVSKDTFKHPQIKNWVGSPDLLTKDSVGDIKCYQPKNFALYSDALLTGDLELIKKEFPKEYWQLISNAIICDKKYAEAVVYLPYKSELNDIRIMADNYEGVDQWRYRFIIEADDRELAHQIEGLYYKNLNQLKFEVPQQDIDLLTERVKLAITLL
jgi:hypothetical protein